MSENFDQDDSDDLSQSLDLSISSENISATSSNNTTTKRKKRQINRNNNNTIFNSPQNISKRSNFSFTNYFFDLDKNDSRTKYCKVCIKELEGSQKQPYPYSGAGSGTGNLSYHLREKHGITVQNYQDFIDDNGQASIKLYLTSKININKITNYFLNNLPPLSESRQSELTKLVVDFIIHDVQPLHILQNPGFRRMLNGFQLQYRISSANTVKNYIHDAFVWGKNINNPLEVLTDSKTRWNSEYYAWQRILILHAAMKTLATTLQNKSDRISKKEGEQLEKLCLTLEEKKPRYNLWVYDSEDSEITRHISGAKYPTVNLIYPYVRSLIKNFAPISSKSETLDQFIELIYGPPVEDINHLPVENSSESSGNEEEIPSAGNKKQWKHTRFRIHARGRQGYYHKNTGTNKKKGNISEIEDTHTVEYLTPVSSNELLEKMRAAIYLSLDELWNFTTDLDLLNSEVFSCIGLKAALLDPRALKLLGFASNSEKRNTELDIREELKNLDQTSENNSLEIIEDEIDSLSTEVWGNITTQSLQDDELTSYLKEPVASKNQNPLLWWEERKDRYPLLTQLARKYLAVPATSVPSERLFSDAGAHITARRTCLSSDLVEKFLFLKRNSDLVGLFPPES
ncbi:4223_t:CDS:2 [Scutellospora calospora]|uniref:4223_t:CDS:1 n=1 Tax=Scutellospora calospora TaxID=85575 RepID=A0ACA9KUY7_9GLOM|nr:4223_t:CDS:2 [Scutellospora calospora]